MGLLRRHAPSGVGDRRARRVVPARQRAPRLRARPDHAVVGLVADLRRPRVPDPRGRGPDLDPRPVAPGVGIRRGRPRVLHQRDHQCPGEQPQGVQPERGSQLPGDPVRGPVRRPDLRGVRDRREPGRGSGGAEARDPEGGDAVDSHRRGVLRDRGVRAGCGVRFRHRGADVAGGRGGAALRPGLARCCRRDGRRDRHDAQDPARRRPARRDGGGARGGDGVHPWTLRPGEGPEDPRRVRAYHLGREPDRRRGGRRHRLRGVGPGDVR